MCSTISPEKRVEIVARWRTFRLIRRLWWGSIAALLLTAYFCLDFIGIPVLLVVIATAVSLFWPCPWCEEPNGFLMVGSFPLFAWPFGGWCQNCRRSFWGMRHGF
jgi:hypothetical protein